VPYLTKMPKEVPNLKPDTLPDSNRTPRPLVPKNYPKCRIKLATKKENPPDEQSLSSEGFLN